MTTITLKINEKSKAGKTLLSMVRFFTEEKNGVEIVNVPNATTQKAINEAKKGIGLNKSSSHTDLMEKLLS